MLVSLTVWYASFAWVIICLTLLLCNARLHTGLQNIGILNPQVLFDCITTLVEKTFTFENDPIVWKEFKKKRIFPFSTIEESFKSLVTSSWLVNLLKYLHIIAPLEEQKGEEKYFMPCTLARAQPAKATTEFCRGQLAHQIPSLLICFTNGYCPRGLLQPLWCTFLQSKRWSRVSSGVSSMTKSSKIKSHF